MYFILSKILLFLILPFYWSLILLVLALISKDRKRKRVFLIAGLVMLYLFANPLVFKSFARMWDIPPYPSQNTKQYSCVIVLGGFSGAGGYEGGHFGAQADRFIQGLKLLDTKKASHILITGGNGMLNPDDFREAAWAKLQLKQLNVPDSLILLESNSRNTLENAEFSSMVLKKAHLPPPYLLVTSAFHMRRSLMIFKKVGINVVPYACNSMTGHTTGVTLSDFLPDANTLSNWDLYAKEVVGYVINYFK